LNLGEALTRAADYLERHGVESARLNAELLLGWLTGLTRVELYTGFQRPLTEEEAGIYRIILARRSAGYPLQYITRSAGFRGLELEVACGVFIPRPETEVLVERALEVAPERGARVLDIGTGCGNVAVSVARERQGAGVVATDVDWLAVELCRRNAAANGVSDRVRVLQGDVFGPVADDVFDVVVSNPPYVRLDSWDELPVEIRMYEPSRALLAGPDGLDAVRRIVEGAPSHLSAGGWLLLEVDPGQIKEVLGMLSPPVWRDAEAYKDLAGRGRVVRSRLNAEGDA
jgi:release factor glutamine methyltransferase